MGIEDNNTSGRVRSVLGSMFNTAKGYVEEKSRQAKEAQEISEMLARVSRMKNELVISSSQVFFSEKFGKIASFAQKQQFVYRRCQQYRKMVSLEQSGRDRLIEKAGTAEALRENSYEFAESLRKLITEMESYNSQLVRNRTRLSLGNMNANAFTDLMAGFEMLLKSEKLLPIDANRILLLRQNSDKTGSVFQSGIEPMAIKLKKYCYVLYPDFILVLDNYSCMLDILSPAELKISVTETEHVGTYDVFSRKYLSSSRIGKDSRMVKEGPEVKHYEHERRDGRPDTRYKDNAVISCTRDDLAANGVLTISILDEKTEIEFSSYKAAAALIRAAASYCVRPGSSSVSVLRLLDLLLEADDSDNPEIKELYDRYSDYVDEKNPSCRIINGRGM